MFTTVRYLGSIAGDTFTYRSGDYSIVFEKGRSYKVPARYAEFLLTDPAFEAVTKATTPKETE